MKSRDQPGRLRRPAVRYLLLLLIGLYPFAMEYGTFGGVEPLDPLILWRAVAGAWAVTFLLYGLARVVIEDPDARALWLAVVLLICCAYRLAVAVISTIGWPVAAGNPLAATLYAVAVVAVATLVVRPWRRSRRDLVPLLLLAAALVAVNGYRGVARLWENPAGRWRAAADRIVAPPARGSHSDATDAPDIYYIVLDAFGREDTLRKDYGLDLADFVNFLRARGFYVPERARSNYAQTLLSFSSFLNLGYLDPLGAVMGRDSTSWLPLADLIQRNVLMRLAKEAGYEITAIGSDYGPTKRFRQADICHCEQRGLDMFEQVMIGDTLFGVLPLDPWTYGAHRRKILDAFSTLEHLPPTSSRSFVLAHVLLPHPPFTFAPDGSFRRPGRIFMFKEGSDFPGPREEYVRGYRDQAAFVVRRVREIVDTILSRPGPRPVIVIHGDHGPGSMLQQNDPARTDLAERMNIFAAYHFPAGQDRLYASMTPVNGARALTNTFLGTDLPRLPDQSWFSPAEHPFDFTAVPAEPALLAK